MAKDPAFLFYSSDFLTGTMTLSDEQVGKYIRLLCLQHQKGELTEKELLKVSCNDSEILEKFEKQTNGNFINKKLRSVMDQRKESAEKTRQRINNWREKQKNGNDSVTVTEQLQNSSETVMLPFSTVNVIETVIENENENVFGKSENLFTDNFAQIQTWIQQLKISDQIFEQKLMSAGLRISKQELCEALDDYEGLIAQYPAKQKIINIEQFRIAALKEVKEWLKRKKDTKPKPMAEIINNDKFKPHAEAQRKRQEEQRKLNGGN